METKAKSSVYPLVMTAMMAAVIAVISPFSIPAWGEVSFTLCTFVLYLSPYILGWKGAATATVIYILLGMIGMPVFSRFNAGLGVLAGPTGGYILGYVPMVVIGGQIIKAFPKSRAIHLGGMVLATAVLYTLGTMLFCAQTASTLEHALLTCVAPFIPFDLGKVVIATGLGPVLRERLIKAGIHPEG